MHIRNHLYFPDIVDIETKLLQYIYIGGLLKVLFFLNRSIGTKLPWPRFTIDLCVAKNTIYMH